MDIYGNIWKKGAGKISAKKVAREARRLWRQITDVFPYVFVWRWKKWRGETDGTVAYLQSPIHYVMFENIHRCLPDVRIVAGNEKTARYLAARGIDHFTGRLYPDAVIFADYNQNRYPVGIRKIQIYHGVGPKNYYYAKGDKDMHYLVPGRCAAERLRAQGKENVHVVGYPKTDGFFSGRLAKEEICRRLGADPGRKTLLYTPTWGEASTAPVLYKDLDRLGARYNVIAKLHDHSPEEWRDLYRGLPNVIFCEDADPTACQYVADLLISDFSSTLFEYAQLGRPVIAYGVSDETLRANATDPRWWDMTCRAATPAELEDKVAELLAGGWRPSEYYRRLIGDIFAYSDGRCAERAAAAIESIAGRSAVRAGREYGPEAGLGAPLGEGAATLKPRR